MPNLIRLSHCYSWSMAWVEMLVAGWIANSTDRSESWLLRKTLHMMIIIFNLFALELLYNDLQSWVQIIWITISQIKMWYKINVEQSSCNNHFDLLFSMELSFLYFGLLAKSELICLVYWKQKEWWTPICSSSRCGTLDGENDNKIIL